MPPHNPTVQKVGDRYALLYIANSGRQGHPGNQRIGMMTADAPEGPWKKVGKDGMILAPPDERAFFNHKSSNGVNNPALLPHSDGRFLLYFKSNDTTQGKKWSPKMGVAIANRLEGPYVQRKEPVTANERVIEDGYAFMMDGKVYLLTTDNHGTIKRGGGLLWTSKDGIRFDSQPAMGFDVMQPYLHGVDTKAAQDYYGP